MRINENPTKRAWPFLPLLSAAVVTVTVVAQSPPTDAETHMANARAAAGMEFRNTFINLCLPGGGRAGEGHQPRDGARRDTGPRQLVRPAVQDLRQPLLARTRQHSSWALQTSDGLIIIDTNFAWATEPEIIEGLPKLGLNPRDIKYVVLSHAHGDHDQGAAELQKRFGAKVVMGAADWETTLQRPPTAAGGVPTRDIVVGPEGIS